MLAPCIRKCQPPDPTMTDAHSCAARRFVLWCVYPTLSDESSEEVALVLLTDLGLFRAIVERSELSHRHIAMRAGVANGTVSNLLAGRRTGCSPAVFAALLYVLGPEISAAFRPRKQVAA